MIFWRGEGSRRAGAGLRFAEVWAAEETLDQVGSRLAAGRGLLDIKICMPTRQGIVCGRLKASRRICRVQSRYGSPPGRSFCAYKRNQNTLGAAPQDPLTLKLRLDTNDAKASSVRRRRYALKVPAAHFMLGNCKPIAGSHDVEPMGWISSCLPRRPLPRCGGGERGGGKYAVATFGAHLCAVRICFSRLLREKQYSYPAQLSVKGVCQGGIRPP